MSHDTDKLIRQLSLVAFLMAERRLLTARDVKSNVEGYSEMSDEAFARRFYSDRAELLALGVPLQSQRDEFTGEELYTLRSENYFLSKLELDDDELAALQTALYLLEGKFAYAEPLRLALQNLALGRPGFGDHATQTAVRVEVLDPDYSSEMPGRLGKLEGAISKQRTIKFPYHSISRNKQSERTVNPYGLLSDNGSWYVIGQDLDRKDIRTFRVSRIRGDIRFATRRERDFRVPADFDIDAVPRPATLADRRHRGRSADRARRRHRLVGRARVRERGRARGRRLRHRLLVAPAARILDPAPGRPRDPDRARRAPPRGRPGAARGPRAPRGGCAEARPHRRLPSAPRSPASAPPVRSCRNASRCSRHCSPTCSPRAAKDMTPSSLPPRSSSASTFPQRSSKSTSNCCNLVNFGGGCYTVYAALDGDSVHVDKELYGDTFRLAPRLTPLEASAIRLALEFVGPMIAADAHAPLDRVRKKLEETFGQFELSQTPNPQIVEAEADLVATLTEGIRERRLVEIEYQKEGEPTWSKRVIEPYSLERELPNWRVHTWDRTRDAERSFRLDRMRSAQPDEGRLRAAASVRAARVP